MTLRERDFYEAKIARAYHAVGMLADRCGLFDHPQVSAALDCFADPGALIGAWSLQDDALAPGTEWTGEDAAAAAVPAGGVYWG